MILNSAQLNTSMLNAGTVPAAAPSAPSLSPVLNVPFRFEIYSRAGVWQSRVTYWRGGDRQIAMNQPDTLRIEIAADDESADDLVFPNEVWMWRAEYDTVWQKYKILRTSRVRNADGDWITVEAKSLLDDLSRELVTLYETPITTELDEATQITTVTHEKVTVQNIIGGLLAAYQTQTPAIGLGIVDAGIGNTEIAIRFENKSILACLADIHRIVGGYYYLDISRKLHWRRSIGYDVGHWVRLNHNMVSIQVDTDYTAIKTRMLGYGAGFSNETRLASTQNDTAAQAEYGVIVGTAMQKTIDEQDTLDAMTEAELARWATPATSYRIGVVDLSQIDPVNYSFETLMLTPGTKVNVLCDSPEVDIETRVMRIKWNLADPAAVEVEFSDPLSGSESWGGNDGTHKKDLVDNVIDLMKEVVEAKNDEGVARSIARLMDPATDEIKDIMTRANAAARLATELATDYGTDENIDDFSDAMLDRLIDAFTDATHPKYAALRDALSQGENNIWVAFDGS